MRQRAIAAADVLQSGGRHADDRERFARQPDRLSDDRRIAVKTPLPKAVTQYDDRALIRNLFFAGEFAAQRRLETERSEIAR